MREITVKDQLIFALKIVLAALGAFYVCNAFNLPQTQWAVMTSVMVLSALSGFGKAKGIYRIIGTCLGALLGLILNVLMNDFPLALLIASALCGIAGAYYQYTHNSPRSYMILMAGFTAMVINVGALSVGPNGLFETMVWRVLEIFVGVVIANIVDSLFPSRTISSVILSRADEWIKDVEKWLLSTLNGQILENQTDQGLQAALADLEEMDQMIFHSRFESSVTQEQHRLFGLLRKRMLLAIPLISSLKIQVTSLKKELGAELSPELKTLIEKTNGWVSLDGIAGKKETKSLLADLDTFTSYRNVGSGWLTLLERNFASTLKELAQTFNEIRQITSVMRSGQARQSIVLRAFRGEALPIAKHVDEKVAWLSIFPGFIATTVILILWGLTGWAYMAGAFLIGSIMAIMLGTVDDPAKALKGVTVLSLVIGLVAGLYNYGVYPQVQTFGGLALALAVPIFAMGFIYAKNQAGFMLLLLFVSNVGLSTNYSPMPINIYVESTMATIVGFVIAMWSNSLVRSFTSEWMIERLISLGRIDIVNFKKSQIGVHRFNFINVMLNRLALIVPRLKASTDTELKFMDILSDIQVGFDLAYLKDHKNEVSSSSQRLVEKIILGSSLDFEGNTDPRKPLTLSSDRLQEIDQAILSVAENDLKGNGTALFLSHLTNLRLHFFADATPLQLKPQLSGGPL